jgi:hypothetical protein
VQMLTRGHYPIVDTALASHMQGILRVVQVPGSTGPPASRPD